MPYALLCTLLGLALGWVPMIAHGPIPYKFDAYGLRGTTAVWGWYTARLSVGFLVGVTTWPGTWWLRGALCGLVMLLPLGFISLANPMCGAPCMFWNEVTGAAIGVVVGGIAFAVTGRHHR